MCTCVLGNELDLLEHADVAFSGPVLRLEHRERSDHALLRVDEAVKGSSVGEQLWVSYGVNATSCDPWPMTTGHVYDVFAYHDADGSLHTDLCSGNREITSRITELRPGCGRCDAQTTPDLGALLLLGALVVGWASRRRTA